MFFRSRAQRIVDSKTQQPLADQTPAENKYMLIYPTHIPPTMNDEGVWFRFSAYVIITVVDNENHRCSWEYATFRKYPWLLCSVRWQALSEIDGITKYETIEVFGGILSYFMIPFFKKPLNHCFRASAEALRSRCERIQ
jgi:hypothetical protein